MSCRSEYIHTEKYESGEVKLFAENTKEEPQNLAFLFPAMIGYFKTVIPDKKVLDIGCGPGYWCYKLALNGAKSVDGFDIQEDMVQLAKKATSQFNTVNIQVGDVMGMPYDDNAFDVAISIYITCSLRLEALVCHFKEMHRVLAPGGKAMVVCNSKPGFKKMFLRSKANQEMVENLVAQKLVDLPKYPSQDQVNDAFKDPHDIIQAPLILDQNGHLKQVTDADKLSNGHAVWAINQIMIFPDYFYDDEFIQKQIKDSGLTIENIENYYTEERRIAYNSTKPEVELDKAITDTPPFVMYHLSKPMNI